MAPLKVQGVCMYVCKCVCFYECVQVHVFVCEGENSQKEINVHQLYTNTSRVKRLLLKMP